MADVSFLLLLFFIITSNFDIDSGISLTLPKYNINKNSVEVDRKRVLSFFIDNDNNVFLNNQKINIEQVTQVVSDKIRKAINFPENEKIIVAISTSPKASYDKYINLLDKIKYAYAIERESLSQKVYKKSYKDLTKNQNIEIRYKIPFIINIDND